MRRCDGDNDFKLGRGGELEQIEKKTYKLTLQTLKMLMKDEDRNKHGKRKVDGRKSVLTETIRTIPIWKRLWSRRRDQRSSKGRSKNYEKNELDISNCLKLFGVMI